MTNHSPFVKKLLAHCKPHLGEDTEAGQGIHNMLRELAYRDITTEEELIEFGEGMEEEGNCHIDIKKDKPYDWDVLKMMPNMSAIWMDTDFAVDLEPLVGMAQLEWFTVQGPVTKVTCITPSLVAVQIFRAPRVDLSELRRCSSLDYLYIEESPLADYSFLQGFTSLQNLEIVGGELESIEQIPASAEMVQICLHHHRLRSLEGIDRFPNLHTLEVGCNFIEDLSPILKLPHLRRLNISYNPVANIDILKKLPKFKTFDTLYLSGIPLGNLDLVEDMTNLRAFTANDCGLTDIRGLANKPKLSHLNLKHNSITCLEPLTELPELWLVDLSHNLISALGKFAANVQQIDLSHNAFSDLNRIEVLPSHPAFGLKLSHNHITDLAPIARFTELGHVELAHNKIRSLEPLTALKELHWLDIEHNQVSDITPLQQLKELSMLSLDHNRIKDFSILKNMANIDLEHMDTTANLVETKIRRLPSNCPTAIPLPRDRPRRNPMGYECDLEDMIKTSGHDSDFEPS